MQWIEIITWVAGVILIAYCFYVCRIVVIYTRESYTSTTPNTSVVPVPVAQGPRVVVVQKQVTVETGTASPNPPQPSVAVQPKCNQKKPMEDSTIDPYCSEPRLPESNIIYRETQKVKPKFVYDTTSIPTVDQSMIKERLAPVTSVDPSVLNQQRFNAKRLTSTFL